MPTTDQVTNETKESLYPGLMIPVVVNHITPDVIGVSLKESGFKCNIDPNYIDNNIEEGDILDALVMSINKEDITIKLSCKKMDLKRGHYRSKEFIDKKNYHPNFRRVFIQEAEKKLFTQPNGSYIIRPDPDNLSVTWKIYDNVYRHLRKL